MNTRKLSPEEAAVLEKHLEEAMSYRRGEEARFTNDAPKFLLRKEREIPASLTFLTGVAVGLLLAGAAFVIAVGV